MTAIAETKTFRWLVRMADLFSNSRPVLVNEGSKWKMPIGGVLLRSDSLLVLESGASEGETVPIQEISSAEIIEDAGERYTIELRLKSLQPARATLVFDDDLFFMLVFGALINAAVPCQFGFTPGRLRLLGARATNRLPEES